MPKVKNETNSMYKRIIIQAIKGRMFLHIQGFLSDKENEAVSNRLRKFQDKYNIEVTREEIYGK